MKSQPAVAGALPRVRVGPKYRFSYGPTACRLAQGYGLTPLPWQAMVLDDLLAESAPDKWAVRTFGLAVPRQNGKNAILEVAELFWLTQLGLKVLHTAHEVKTARKAFARLRSFFENPTAYPELAGLVKDIRSTNGQEAIVLTNGGLVEFVARTKGSGRGFTADVLVCDEAQELSEDAWSALSPTLSASASGNSLRVLTGTPPGPTMDGAFWIRQRSRALAKDAGIGWCEWSVPSARVDVADRDVWHAANPSLPDVLHLSEVVEEFGSMAEDTFLRERLGLWASDAQVGVFDAQAWDGARVPDCPDGVPSVGVDASPDGKRLSIAVVVRDGQRLHGEVVVSGSIAGGFGWAVEWIASRWPRPLASVVIDGQSTAMALVPELVSRKVKVTVTSLTDMARACQSWEKALASGDFTHAGQPGLDAEIAGAAKRQVGEAGMWAWKRRGVETGITAPVSMTLAIHGAMTTKRRPGRRQRATVS